MNKTPLIILYDGDCPLCCRKRDFLMRRDPQGALEFINIRNSQFTAEDINTSFHELEKQIHAILPDGTLVNRMEVIRQAYRTIGLSWLIAPTDWPLLRPFFDWLYGLVAKHRMSISHFFRKNENLDP